MVKALLPDVAKVFKSEPGKVVLYPASGTGAWEAALVNTLAPGDRVLSSTTATSAPSSPRPPATSASRSTRCRCAGARASPPSSSRRSCAPTRAAAPPYKAVLVVHNETSTGVTSNVQAVRQALDTTGHDALLIVDTVSSLASIDFRMDEWRVDVTLTGSQKGLMLPPGMALLCVGPRGDRGQPERRQSHATSGTGTGSSPTTRPASTRTPRPRCCCSGCARPSPCCSKRALTTSSGATSGWPSGVRAAVDAWGLKNLCENPSEVSNSLTAVVTPDGIDSGDVMKIARERYDLALGVGLGRMRGKVFRIGHLGALNELEVLGTLGGVEMALAEAGVPIELGAGVAAAQRSFVAGRQAVATPVAAAAR